MASNGNLAPKQDKNNLKQSNGPPALVKYHPYAKSIASNSTASSAKTLQSYFRPSKNNKENHATSMKANAFKHKRNDEEDELNYDYQIYLMNVNKKNSNNSKSANKKEAETKQFKRVIAKTAANKSDKRNDEVDPDAHLSFGDQLKVFAGNTKSIPFYTRFYDELRREQQQIASRSKTPGKIERTRKKYPARFLFEIVGELDSTIDSDDLSSTREFNIRDCLGRMSCMFNEMDEKLERIPRGKYIRCLGEFKVKQDVFNCVRVRLATDSQIAAHNHLVGQTNNYLFCKYN